MILSNTLNVSNNSVPWYGNAGKLLAGAVLAGIAVAATPCLAKNDKGDDTTPYCSNTAKMAARACANDVRDDYWLARARCLNVSDDADREQCVADAQEVKWEIRDGCRDQLDARIELCDLLGEERYDPDLDPDNFDPEFRVANPFLPLHIGNTWEYAGGDEVIVAVVLDKTKLIEGVTTRVVNDIAYVDDVVIENTDDWYAQGHGGDIWYFGEIVGNYETFEGDDPEEPELLNIDGSFKVGRDGAKPGILFSEKPRVGDVFRQEMALGDAEDAAEVIEDRYSYGSDPDLDWQVPQNIAEKLCDDDCLVTREFTPLDPGHEERKYYSPGIGLFLEVDMETGDSIQLVSCMINGVACPDL